MRLSFPESFTEGDVESLFIVPFLREETYCAIPDASIRSKESLATYEIDKGRTRKRYVPDFVIYSESIPVVVVEAKAPSESLDDAYAEAQLYAHELNKKFPADLIPASTVIATNGNEIWLGRWDKNAPDLKLENLNLVVGTKLFESVLRILHWDVLQSRGSTVSKALTPAEWLLPSEWLGSGPIDLRSAV